MIKWCIRIQYRQQKILKTRTLRWVDKGTKNMLVDLMAELERMGAIQIVGIRMVKVYEQD